MSLSATSVICVTSITCAICRLISLLATRFASATNCRYSLGVLSMYSGGCSGR